MNPNQCVFCYAKPYFVTKNGTPVCLKCAQRHEWDPILIEKGEMKKIKGDK